jgi:hypothetical protein
MIILIDVNRPSITTGEAHGGKREAFCLIRNSRKKEQKAQNEDEENVTQSRNGRERAQRTQKRDESTYIKPTARQAADERR